MPERFEVSFNSPQCGWMSIGFEHDSVEFHTTTAAAPHKTALSDMLQTVSELLGSDNDYKKSLQWNRDPEEYDFIFSKRGGAATLEIVEYPTSARQSGESVYRFDGSAIEIAEGFVTTFQQLYDERDVDEFEENWHQKFPVEDFENLKTAVGDFG